ncbi:MAG: nucleoside hydrolase [Leptolyngbyaceae cyanobacterium bins.302]|nr:nucleoside hydrolase [Leptolyngbyaceae cyanobacterium bins.302]
MTQTRPQIMLDTDPGGDDIFALLWLLSLVKQNMADLIAVTTANGNVTAQRTFTNVSQLLSLMDKHLLGKSAIALGRGVISQSDAGEDASHIHGNDGMGNLSITLPVATHDFATAPFADDLIIDRLNANPGEITLVAIAPLTNLAAAEAKSPGILQKAKELVIMGGAFYQPGNITLQAEFNIWFNPEAAEIVFDSRDDIVVLPLDITTQLRFTPQMAVAITQANPDPQFAQFLLSLCDFMVSTALGYRETEGVPAFLVHDAAAIAYLFYPEVFSFRRGEVHIETQGKWTRGKTVISDRPPAQARSNAWIAMQVDEPLFFTHFLADLREF